MSNVASGSSISQTLSHMLHLDKPAAVACYAVATMGALLCLTVGGEELCERALHRNVRIKMGETRERLTKSVRQYWSATPAWSMKSASQVWNCIVTTAVLFYDSTH
jgi:hypothetical protein